jgi:hypothetical protein
MKLFAKLAAFVAAVAFLITGLTYGPAYAKKVVVHAHTRVTKTGKLVHVKAHTRTVAGKKSTYVHAHTRVTKTGKIVHVKGHMRKVGAKKAKAGAH